MQVLRVPKQNKTGRGLFHLIFKKKKTVKMAGLELLLATVVTVY